MRARPKKERKTLQTKRFLALCAGLTALTASAAGANQIYKKTLSLFTPSIKVESLNFARSIPRIATWKISSETALMTKPKVTTLVVSVPQFIRHEENVEATPVVKSVLAKQARSTEYPAQSATEIWTERFIAMDIQAALAKDLSVQIAARTEKMLPRSAVAKVVRTNKALTEPQVTAEADKVDTHVASHPLLFSKKIALNLQLAMNMSIESRDSDSAASSETINDPQHTASKRTELEYSDLVTGFKVDEIQKIDDLIEETQTTEQQALEMNSAPVAEVSVEIQAVPNKQETALSSQGVNSHKTTESIQVVDASKVNITSAMPSPIVDSHVHYAQREPSVAQYAAATAYTTTHVEAEGGAEYISEGNRKQVAATELAVVESKVTATEKEATQPTVTVSYPLIMGHIGPALPPNVPAPVAPAAVAQTQQQEPAPSEVAAVDDEMKRDVKPDKVNPAPAPEPIGVATLPNAFRGKVVEAFSGGDRTISEAKIQIIGSSETLSTDDAGRFKLEETDLNGVLPVIVSREGFHSRRAELTRTNKEHIIELLPENGSRISGLALGETTRNGDAYFFGELIDPDLQSRANYRVWLVSAIDQGPKIPAKYTDENGRPSQSLTGTSERGQFVFQSVPAGSYILIATDGHGVEHAPHVLHFAAGEGIVRKISLGRRRNISGRIINGNTVGANVSGAEVRLFGSAAVAISGSNGNYQMPRTYVDCDAVNYLQIERQGLYRNRVSYKCTDDRLDSYVMPANHVDSVVADAGIKLSVSTGMIFGHVSMPYATKVQLLGPEEVITSETNRGYDYYFDKDGLINPSRGRTAENGNFIVTDAPAEFSYLQVFDMSNRTRAIYPILTSPSTVSVFIQ